MPHERTNLRCHSLGDFDDFQKILIMMTFEMTGRPGNKQDYKTHMVCGIYLRHRRNEIAGLHLDPAASVDRFVPDKKKMRHGHYARKGCRGMTEVSGIEW